MIANRKTNNIGEELNDDRAKVILWVIIGLIYQQAGPRKAIRKGTSPVKYPAHRVYVMALLTSSMALGSVLTI